LAHIYFIINFLSPHKIGNEEQA